LYFVFLVLGFFDGLTFRERKKPVFLFSLYYLISTSNLIIMPNSQTFCLVKKIMKDKMRVEKEKEEEKLKNKFLGCNLLF